MPHISVAKAEDTRFQMVNYPCSLLVPMYHSFTRAADRLKGKKSDRLEDCRGIKEVLRICELAGYMEFDGKVGVRVIEKGLMGMLVSEVLAIPGFVSTRLV